VDVLLASASWGGGGGSGLPADATAAMGVGCSRPPFAPAAAALESCAPCGPLGIPLGIPFDIPFGGARGCASAMVMLPLGDVRPEPTILPRGDTVRLAGRESACMLLMEPPLEADGSGSAVSVALAVRWQGGSGSKDGAGGGGAAVAATWRSLTHLLLSASDSLTSGIMLCSRDGTERPSSRGRPPKPTDACSELSPWLTPGACAGLGGV